MTTSDRPGHGAPPSTDEADLPAGVDGRVLASDGDLDTLATLTLEVMGAGPGAACYLSTVATDGRTLQVKGWAVATDDGITARPSAPPADSLAVDATTAGRALRTGTVVHVQRPADANQQRTQLGLRTLLAAHPANQIVAAPVGAGNGQAFGVLTLTLPPGHPTMSREDRDRLGALARRMAVVVDRTRLRSALMQARRHERGVIEINERAPSCASIDELFAFVTEVTTRSLEADVGVLLRVLPDGTEAVLAAGIGLPVEQIGTLRVSTNGPIIKRLLDGQRAVHLVDNAEADDAPTGVKLVFGVDSSLTVAVWHQHRAIAVLGVGRRSRATFTEDDERFLVTVAATVGTLLDARATQDRLRRQALSDELTGLPNRNFMAVRVQEAIARSAAEGSNVALLLADLDGFKVLNDSLGHLAGDHILRVVAARLSGLIRPGDVLARLGGDEFAVLCHGADERMAVGIAERLLAALTEPVRVEGTEVVPRASIGITVYDPSAPELHGDAGDLLPQADLAMYRAKASPRHRIAVYDVAMHEAVQQRLLLEQGLRAAIGTDQLSLHYQPIVRLSDGAVRSLEALTRWTHPTLGPVRPDQFIAVAEESDLICALSTWVLREVCQQVVRWRTDGLLTDSACVALNMSARDLTDPGMVERFQRVLTETGCDPTWLYVEVTESLFTDAAGAEAVRELKQLGLHIALDDYGTGFSSLGQLKRVPVDVLKIDRSFVNNLLTDPVDATIVTSTIALAHALGKRVVAEGIETTEQLHRLLELGCDSGQGYLFARPQPVDVISRYLAEGVPDLAANLGL